MEINIDQQKEEFVSLCRSLIHRDGIEDLLSWLEKSDFYIAPASTRYHGAYAGGLCQHSIDVYNYAQKLSPLLDYEPNPESLAIATLFHDVCKINFYKKDWRNQKVDGVWVQVPCYSIDERFAFGGHGSKSVYQVQWFMKITQEEAVAINCHMGFSDGNPNTVRDVSNAYEKFPLAWIVHVADEAATFLLSNAR